MSASPSQAWRDTPGFWRSGSGKLCRAQPQRFALTPSFQNSGPRPARRDSDMHNAYIIEIGEEAVGIAARDRGGFRFHSALHALNGLDGRLFPSVLDATRAARALVDRAPSRQRRMLLTEQD
jgi:hypothetical protein